MGKRLERFGEVRIIDETNGFGVDLSRRQRVDFGVPPQTWEQSSLAKGGFCTCILFADEIRKNPQVLEEGPSF